jgi:hypothetical protein
VTLDDAITALEEQNDRFTREMRRFGADLLRSAAEAIAEGNRWVEAEWDDEDDLVNATDFFIYAGQWANEAFRLRETYDDPQDDPEQHVFTVEFEENAKAVRKKARELLRSTLHRTEVLRSGL